MTVPETRLADPHTDLYKLLVEYFIQVEKLSIDAAHAKVDRMHKYFDAIGE